MITTWKKELLLLFLIFYLSLSIDIEDSEISYLENYGYIETDNTVAALRTDDFYSEKIREFQEMLALPLTGVLDTATKNMMKAPRCGLRDKDKRRGKRAHPRDVSKWSKKALTYWVKNAPISDNHYDEVRKEIKKAFKAWGDVTGLTFEEKESSNGMDVDIALSFEPRDHGDDTPFQENVLAHASFPPDGDVHFNNDKNYKVDSGFYEEVSLLHVTLHELGHSLGLRHINMTDSVMFPTITYSPTQLSSDDIAAVQALYGEHREEGDSDLPDPCDGRRIDAAATIGKEVYLFKDKWFWTFRNGRLHTRPRLVSSYWPEITGTVDSVLSHNGYQYFFVGDNIYIYSDGRVLWGTRKLTVWDIPSEVKKIRVAFAWNNGESTKFHLWADNTEYIYDPVLKTIKTELISWTLDRVTANLVVHGDNYIFTDRGVHQETMTTFTYKEPVPFSKLFHCEDTTSSHPEPETPIAPCLPSLEDHEKSTPLGKCAVNKEEVVNKLQVRGYVKLYNDDERIDCVYPEGTILYFKKRRSGTRESALFVKRDESCLKTKDGSFYHATTTFFVNHYCDYNGECTLLAYYGDIKAVNGGKTYTERGHINVDNTTKPVNDRNAYLYDVVSVLDGSCPQKVCSKYVV